MIKILENIYKTLIIIDTIDAKIVKELFEIYPHLENIISLPKNDSQLILEESRVIESLLKCDTKQYKIEDLLEIDCLNNNKEMLNEIIFKGQNKMSVESLLVKLFFDCIKRKEIFSETLRNIQKVIPKFPITSTKLLEHLLRNSNINLKIMLLYICSRFLSIPFLIPNPIEDEGFNLLREEPKQRFCLITELVYLLEDSCSNLLSFSFSKKRHSGPKGKSHILNNIFGRNFLTGDTLRTKTLIEFQFDFHYALPLKFNIADYHGEADINIIKDLIPFFNYYFLHLTSEEFDSYKEDINGLLEDIKEIHNKFSLIVFIHQEKFSKINIKQENGILYCRINSIRNMPETEIRNLKDEIWRLIIKEDQLDSFYRINCAKNKYIDICKKFNEFHDVNLISEKQRSIREFESFLFNFKEDFMDIKLIPFNKTFVDYCGKLKLYNNEYNRMTEERQNEESRIIDGLLDKYQTQPIAEIVSRFHELLNNEHYLCILYDSSSRLKLKIEEGLSQHLKEKNAIIDEINKNKDETKTEYLESERERISEIIRKKSFSFEFIVRELYHISRIEKIDYNKPEKQYFERLSHHLIKCGQPFEVIDGDNLHYISDFYGNLFRNSQANILVVSIMGPQSSGKSTLLNFLFGTQFASSSGRCTRGMYGAIMDIKNHPKYEKLLILDTEGILSAERNDPLFDRKLILFCLCISHVTILCNKGDVHKGMTDILKLTSECMKDLKEQKFLNPNVFVVLNALTDINSDKLMLPFQNLNIDLAGVKMLPFAYEMKDVHSDIKVNIPSTSFSQKCLDFRNEILNQYQKNSDQNPYSLSNWFEFSQKMWEKIDKLKNLIDYTNIEEMKQDTQIKKLIEGYLKDFKRLMSENEDDNAKLNVILEKEVQDFEIEKFNSISESLNNRVERETETFRDEIMKKFEEECKERDISKELMLKNKKLLEMNIIRCIEDWELILSQKLNEKRVIQSRFGDSLLNSELDRLMKENNYQPYDKEIALSLFNQFWDQQIKNLKMKSKLNMESKKEQCYKLVKNYYESFNKLLSGSHAPELEKRLKQYFETRDLNIIKNVLNDTDLLYFQEGKIPDIKLIFEHLQIEKKYLKMPNDLFEEKHKCIFVRINPAKAFRKDIFIKQEYKNRQFINLYLWKLNMSRKDIEELLRVIFFNIQNEANTHYIDFSFDDEIIKDFTSKIHKSLDKNLDLVVNELNCEICLRFKVKKSEYFEEPRYHPRYFDRNLLYDYFECDKDYFETLKSFDANIILKRKEVKHSHNQKDKIGELLSWYVNPTSNTMSREKIRIGISFFQEYFKWDRIFEEIMNFVLESVYKTNSQIGNLNFVEQINKFHEACEMNINLGENIEDSFCLFSSDVVLNLIKKTEELIDKINQEMGVFKYQINQTTIAIFHQIVMTLFWTIFTVQDYYRDNGIIRTNDNNRKCYENFSVSVLTKDSLNFDKNSAEIISKKLFEDIKAKLLKEAQTKFHTNIKLYENQFETHNGMKYLDDLIKEVKNKIEDVLKFMLDPRERLSKLFEEKWHEISSPLYANIKLSWSAGMTGYLKIIKDLFSKLEKDLSSKNLLMQSNMLFKIIENDKIERDTMAQEEHEIQLRELIVKYIHDSIGGQWKNEDEFVMKDDIKVKPINSLPKVDRVEDEFLRNLLQSSLKGKSIINIPVFLTEIISLLDDKIKNSNHFKPSMMVLDEHNLEKKYKEKFIGCYKACPLCRRKCDQAHTGLNEKHKCATGHQFKVFGGNRFENNDPSFVSCDMMKDSDDVEFEGEIKKWKEFRSSQPDWDFMCESSLDRVNFIERNKDIWNLIRTQLCHYYLKNKNIKIKNKEWFDQNNYIKSTHLILLLDDSISMTWGTKGGSTRWDDLLKAVISTFETIMKNLFLKLKTKISVLLHSSTTITSFEEKEPSIDLINLIKPRFDFTNFDEALYKGYECILKSEERYDSIIVAFMSDGGDAIPTKIIDVINKDQKNVKNKISFNCIMFGDDEYGKKTQKEIAARLGGKFTTALTVDDLKASFIEILNIKN